MDYLFVVAFAVNNTFCKSTSQSRNQKGNLINYFEVEFENVASANLGEIYEKAQQQNISGIDNDEQIYNY